MRPRAIIVFDVLRQGPAQMALVDHHDLIEAFAANRTYDPLDVRIRFAARLLG